MRFGIVLEWFGVFLCVLGVVWGVSTVRRTAGVLYTTYMRTVTGVTSRKEN